MKEYEKKKRSEKYQNVHILKQFKNIWFYFQDNSVCFDKLIRASWSYINFLSHAL